MDMNLPGLKQFEFAASLFGQAANRKGLAPIEVQSFGPSPLRSPNRKGVGVSGRIEARSGLRMMPTPGLHEADIAFECRNHELSCRATVLLNRWSAPHRSSGKRSQGPAAGSQCYDELGAWELPGRRKRWRGRALPKARSLSWSTWLISVVLGSSTRLIVSESKDGRRPPRFLSNRGLV